MKSFYSRIAGSVCVITLTILFVGSALAQKLALLQYLINPNLDANFLTFDKKS